MTVQDVATLLAVAALVIGSLTLIAGLIGAAAPLAGPIRRAWETIVVSVGGRARWLAWSLAVAATLGSLYFSEIADFVPCTYCWYQRIAMYPLALLIGVAAFSRDRAATSYLLPLAGIGGAISAYHYLIQQFPDLSTGACTSATPCTAAYVWEFDFVSIPLMAMVAFATIVLLLVIDRAAIRRTD